jgi:outer membrane immunogenic protein
MWRHVLACLTVATAVPAFAADLPPRVPEPQVYAPAPAPFYNWSGLYIGGHIGGGWGDETATNVNASPLAAAGSATVGKPTGFLGGGQIGVNYQMNTWVFGIEADVSWSDVKETTVTASLVPGISLNGSSNTNWLATVTGRVGYAVNNWLLYAKGGVAWSDVDYTAALVTAGVAAPAFVVSDTRVGWIVGAGVEFGFWNNWSAKLEYNFIDFGTERYSFTVAGATAPVDIESQIHVFKAGLNYRFNWAGRS